MHFNFFSFMVVFFFLLRCTVYLSHSLHRWLVTRLRFSVTYFLFGCHLSIILTCALKYQYILYKYTFWFLNHYLYLLHIIRKINTSYIYTVYSIQTIGGKEVKKIVNVSTNVSYLILKKKKRNSEGKIILFCFT